MPCLLFAPDDDARRGQERGRAVVEADVEHGRAAPLGPEREELRRIGAEDHAADVGFGVAHRVEHDVKHLHVGDRAVGVGGAGAERLAGGAVPAERERRGGAAAEGRDAQMQLVPVVPVDVAEADREGRRGEADVFGVEHVRAGVAVEVLIAADGLIGLGLDRRDGVGAGLERGVELLVVGVEIGHHDAVGLRPLVELVVGGMVACHKISSISYLP